MLSVYWVRVQPELSSDCFLGGFSPDLYGGNQICWSSEAQEPGPVRRQHPTAALLFRNMLSASLSETSQTHTFLTLNQHPRVQLYEITASDLSMYLGVKGGKLKGKKE